MRICSPHCGIGMESNSGGEVYERELVYRLSKNGVEQDVLLPNSHGPVLPSQNIHIHKLRIRKNIPLSLANFGYLKRIKDIYRERPYDLLRVHSLRFAGPVSFLARKLYGLRVPIVSHHHHVDKEFLPNIVDKIVLKSSDAIITVSEFSKKQLLEFVHVDEKKIHVLPNGINEEMKANKKNGDLCAKLGLDNKKIILSFGGLKRRKNLPFLIDSFNKLVKNGKTSYVLLLAGGGELKNELMEMVKQLNLQANVKFLGFVPEEEKLGIYNLANVFVTTSSLEGFGRTAAEAMACGIPVLAPNVASLPEVVEDNKTGFLYKSGCENDFCNKLVTLLENSSLQKALGEAGQKLVRDKFSWDKIINKMINIYEEIVKNYKGNHPGIGFAMPRKNGK